MIGVKGVKHFALAGSVALAMGACGGGDGGEGASPASTEGHSHGGHSHEVGTPVDNFIFTLGKPGDESEATRTIAVETVSGFRYSPMELEVKSGETVTFEVTNTDEIPHELVLGNAAYQELHEQQVQAGGVYHDYSRFSVHVDPGDSLGFTWTFDKKGRVLFACHVQGHYERGMVGQIQVT